MSVPFIFLLAIPVLLGIYILARGSAKSRWGIFWRITGAFLLALPCGGLAYLFVGIGIARARNVGHFFSVPFGGYAVSDSALTLSLLAWTTAFFCLMALLLRAISSQSPRGSSGSNGPS